MLIFLLKSAACLAIFMAFYTFFLERENMHVFKRYYLLCALILAFGIPLVTFTQYIEVAFLPILNSSIEPVVYYTEQIPQPQETNYLPIILWSIYAAGVLLFGVKFFMNLLHIIFKIKRNPKLKSNHIVHVLLSDLITPHTFFKYIFFNKQKFEQREIPQEVFWHEETHAKQNHSIDVLSVELLQVVFWFNPLIYIVKHSIKMNHEFLADQAVLNRGISASNYQHILLAFSSDAAESPLANAINYSSTRHAIGMIKKRFTVMKANTSKRNIWLRRILLLPLLALTLYGFSEKMEVQKPVSAQISSSDTSQDNLINNDEINSQLQSNKIIIENIEKEPYFVILLNNKGMYLVNDDIGTIEDIENDFKAIAADKNKSKIIVFRYELYTPQADIDRVMDLVNKYHLTRIEFEPEESTHNNRAQTKATPEEIKDYNKLAKFYNAQNDDYRIIKLAEMKRIQDIYNKMNEEQKTIAEPQPNFPPPPPPPSPPIPGKSPEEQKIINEKSQEDIRKQGYYTYQHKNRKGEDETVKVIFDPPLTPPPPASSKVLDTNTNKNIVLLEEWYITIDNKKYYYPYNKGDLKKYYDKYGNEVELNIVKEYNNKNDLFMKLKDEGQHYVHKTEKGKREMDELYTDLTGIYVRMSIENKRKVNAPQSLILPYIILTKNNGEVYYKKENELTEEDKNRLPPPPPPPPAKKN